ncbi:MAG: DNA translocase FtsK [Sphingobium sp.]
MSDHYQQAVLCVVAAQRGSTTLVQRTLGIGYNSAARLIERMEREGIVSTPDRNGARQVLVQSLQHFPTERMHAAAHAASDREIMIDALEKALADARSGRLEAFAFAGIGHGDDVLSFSFDDDRPDDQVKLLTTIAKLYRIVGRVR